MPALFLALVAAIAVAWLTNGDLRKLEKTPLRHGWLLAVAVVMQLALFPPILGGRPFGTATPYLYVTSLVLVLVALLLNLRTAGLPLAAAGVGLNLVCILANGGYMPTPRWAAEAAGIAGEYVPLAGGPAGASVYAYSIMYSRPKLAFLGDVLVLPMGRFAAALSIGDVLLALGVAWLLIHYSRRPRGRHLKGVSRPASKPERPEPEHTT